MNPEAALVPEARAYSTEQELVQRGTAAVSPP
jgi:hypothetical protein